MKSSTTQFKNNQGAIIATFHEEQLQTPEQLAYIQRLNSMHLGDYVTRLNYLRYTPDTEGIMCESSHFANVIFNSDAQQWEEFQA